MSAEQIESPDYHHAILNSEWYRIVGLLGVLSALMVYTILRGIIVDGFRLLWIQTAVLAVVIGQEFVVLRVVERALRQKRDVPGTIWAINVTVESQLPTVTLFLLLASQWMTPYQVLVAPAALVYLLFIILSTLRLSPGLTILTGILSALGYLSVVFYIEDRFQHSRDHLGAFPLKFYGVYASVILIAGILGALVAGRIKTYVAAALREAEFRHRLEKVKHDLDIARSIQQDLLPSQAPKLDDFDIAGWNQPADQTGGDYFDWQSLPNGHLAISLGDATGHGIGPALVSASCRAYARASFVIDEHNQVLERLNLLLAEDLSANRFVTFAVVFLDPEKSEVEILSAGHGPILWYKRATDELETLEAQGIPLGMIPGIGYENGLVRRLAPGDMIVLVTDGFYEWENPNGQQFGLLRLESVILRSHDCTAEQVIASLRSAVESFSKGTEQNDDLTAVVIQRKARAKEAMTHLTVKAPAN